jgi:hypothetical protein
MFLKNQSGYREQERSVSALIFCTSRKKDFEEGALALTEIKYVINYRRKAFLLTIYTVKIYVSDKRFQNKELNQM